MATVRQTKPPGPQEIVNFLGVNESVGDTEIKIGEAVRQENFRITKNMKAQKRPGQAYFIRCDDPIRGMWDGVIGGKNVIIFSTGGFLYERNMAVLSSETSLANLLVSAWDDTGIWDDGGTWDESSNPPVVQLGAIADEYVEFLWFDGKLQIKTLTQWKTYDGTTYTDSVPYIPTVAINTPPAGGGTLFEEVNILTGKKQQWFTQAGAATQFFIAETSVNSIDQVYVNGVLQTLTTHYTVDLALGRVTFVTAPPAQAQVKIFWTKNNTTPSLVLNHPYMTDFGVDNDTNLFLFGGSHEKSTFRFSMVGKPNYFPANSFVVVGSDQFYITDMIAQQQSLLIYKEDSTRIVTPSVNPLYADNTGLNPYNFGYQDLNENVGNISPRAVRLIKDTPLSVYGFSWWLWKITSIESQRSADIISDRIKLSLQDLDLSTAVTWDNQNEKEYWCCIGDKVFVWNYGNDTIYTYTNMSADQFIEIGGVIYYRSGNDIIKVSSEYKGDFGGTIPCKLYLGFTDFGALQYRKMMRDEWLAIAPASNTSVNVKFITDRVEEDDASTVTVSYRFLNFNELNFNELSFKTNVNPQPKRLKSKVKKFTYIQVLFENDTNDETLTILKLLMNAQVQGLSR